MGILTSLVTEALAEPRRILAQSPENPSTPLSNPASWLYDAFGASQTVAGPPVNELNAIRATTVFRCVSIIANTIASLPWNVYKRTKDGRETADQHPLYRLLHDAPNRITSSYTFRQIITAGLLTNGNGFAVIGRNNGGRILDLLQIPPQDVEVARIGSPGTYRLDYKVHLDSKPYDVSQENILHVPGLGFDGVRGISVISAVGRQAISLDLAIEDFQARLMAASMRPSGVVEIDKSLSPEGLDTLRNAFERLYAGREKAGKTVFLDRGMKFSAMQINPEDAQTLENRHFQVADIARIYGVPLHLLGETEKATSWGSGIEQQQIAFTVYVIGPWLKSIEQEFNRKLFRAPYFCEFSVQGLLRGDSKARSEFYSKGVNNGWLMPNEARRFENLPAEEGADQLFINRASVPIDQAGQEAAASLPPEPPTPAEPPEPPEPEEE